MVFSPSGNISREMGPARSWGAVGIEEVAAGAMVIKGGEYVGVQRTEGLGFVYIFYIDGEQCSGLYGVTRPDNFTT